MRYCKDCWNFDRCNVERKTVDFAVDDGVCRQFDGKPMTNADRIRAMTDEELAVFLRTVECDVEEFPFIQDWDKWLQQPAEGD